MSTERGAIHPNKREYVLIELKRPSKTLTRKEIDQVEDYLTSLSSQDDFNNTDTTWTVYLVGGDYDETVKSRITQAERLVGLYHKGINSTIWIKTWGELIRENEGRLRFVQDRLDINVAQSEIEARISKLKASVLKEDQENVAETEPA